MPFSIISPTIEDTQEFEWHGLTRADLTDVWELLESVNRADDNDYNESVDDLERQFDDPWSNPLTDGRIVRTIKGKIAAFVRIFANPEPKSQNTAFVVCEIAPEAREQGLELECLDWAEERAAVRLAEAAQTDGAQAMPRVIRVGIPETDTSKVELYTSRGYEHVRSFYKMNRDLSEPIPDNPLPHGLTFRVYDESLDEPMRHAFNEAFADHWGNEDVTAEEWHPFIMDVSDVRRDLTLLVMDGDEVVAFCINRVRTEENERLGIRRGWVDGLGTRRNWRKRGIASALLSESMRRFRAEGLDLAGLGVDTENLTGALALYEHLGFKPSKTRVVLEKRVG